MKKTGFIILGLLFSLFSSAQVFGGSTNFEQHKVEKHAKWTISFDESKAIIGEEFQITFDVTIDDEWYIYGTEFLDRVYPTELKYDVKKGISEKTIYKSIGAETVNDEYLGEITEFKKKGKYVLTVTPTSSKVDIKGLMYYGICKEGTCMPAEESFDITFSAKKGTQIKDTESSTIIKVENTDPKIPSNSRIEEPEGASDTKITEEGDQSVLNQLLACCQNGTSANSDQSKESKSLANESTVQIERKAGWGDIIVERYEAQTLIVTDWFDILLFMGLAFLGGLTALLTPCVFPMIPMTVAFFTKQGDGKTKAAGIRNAFLYGTFIIVIYTLIGVVGAAINGPSFATWLSTNWIPNSAFFIIFILFALSFLGLFEITLPSGLVNKMDKNADKGGLMGIFFMAFTLVLVSFSCTGPIVGNILVLAAGGDWIKPIAGMFAFASAFAIPFTLFAIFPSWLNSLPKSGGWLGSVKTVLGFLELALALKFLSQIDLAYGWNFLDREIFLSLWIAIFGVIGFYLLGKLKLSHEGDSQPIGVFRLILSIATFSFVIYMVPGLWGAPLKSLSGLMPPLTTQDFNLDKRVGNDDLCNEPMHNDHFEFPLGLNGYYDLREAIQCAAKQNKPLFIDFTGKTCSNCREMEQKVWSDDKVWDLLNDEFVKVALYVDVNTIELPLEERYLGQNGRQIYELGRANLSFQAQKFDKASQPLYAIVSFNKDKSTKDVIYLNELQNPIAYDRDINKFITFLKMGVKEHKKYIK